MSPTLTIGNRCIGPGRPALVIAEIGVNHDGSLSRALELVDHAAAAGADAVKLQVFRARELMHASGRFAAYQEGCSCAGDPVDMLRQYELPPLDICHIVEAIRQRGMIPLATPFSLADFDVIECLDLPAIKIASPDLVNWPLLHRAVALHVPLLISTGAATAEEVATTAGWLRNWGADFAFLHCTSSYPVAEADANLCWIAELGQRFAAPAGFSDHTCSELTGALAVTAGACIIEKHLTHDRSALGPDHGVSADPEQFARYVKGIRLAETMRGTAGKRLLPVEEDVRQVSRQSLVLRRKVAAGQAIGEADLATQRPGTGIPAAMFTKVVGRRAIRSLPAGTLLQWDMLIENERMHTPLAAAS